MSGHSAGSVARVGNNPFLKAVAALSTLCGWTSAALVVAAVAITCQMIFIRFVLNGSTVWQTEAVIYLVIASTLIGLPYVQRLRGHVNVDLVPLAVKGRARKVLGIAVLLAAIAIMGVVLFYAVELWLFAYERNWKSDTVWGVRLWIPYLAMPVGFGLLTLQLIADLVAVLTNVEPPFGIDEDPLTVHAGAEGARDAEGL
ncbi:TRAP transporter small permease [Profundibacterium mesophilum]|uniref:TRAP transporter small permease protein n=1 Tax=Profundibacterium mesophilum KAUST100406-0324 TaxID=1037889 RepID=A0A921NT69_9RHOB|nr:TRAP transporter small permease [Profundibacterium mesophilum]KAF0674681.1 Tripartite ATP-independent periplasmic transporters DctQ component domain containing protein [Profundibacterium mesophilum KAUST100406-0324]